MKKEEKNENNEINFNKGNRNARICLFKFNYNLMKKIKSEIS